MRETRLTCDGCRAQVELASDDPEVENWVIVVGHGDFCPHCGGLFGRQEHIDLPERAHRALNSLSEMRAFDAREHVSAI
jgi:hypothetical protein